MGGIVLRIMTFNIWGCNYPKEGPNSWSERSALNVAVIRRHAPDLIGLQEAQEGNLATYRELLTEYTIISGNQYGDNPPTEFNAILYRHDRLELLQQGEFWYSPTPDEPSTGYGVDYPMGATWARFRDRQTGAEFLHLNTHFEDGPWGELSRTEGARLIVERLSAAGLPAILTGDFNCNPDSAAHRFFEEADFADAWLSVGNHDGADSTFHGLHGEAYSAAEYSDGANTYWRIDWIMVKGARTAACTIVRDAQPPQYPSDHYPVIADIHI